MKKHLASILALGAIVPMFWYNIIPWAAEYCPKDNGKLIDYTVERQNGFGEIVTLVFGGDSQADLCTHVEKFPG